MSYSRRAFLVTSLQTASLPLLAQAQAEARKVVVAAELEPAALAGLKAVEAGGNAMDAAAAACLATCMLEPCAVDLGGYVTCAVVLDGKTGTVWAVMQTPRRRPQLRRRCIKSYPETRRARARTRMNTAAR